VEAVVQNQDNREHDLLDSDDYYQFEGGMAATVETLRGEPPAIYHNDHSRPERPVIRTLSRKRLAASSAPRRQPEMDRRLQAARLQGRLRDGRDGRLSVRLRRHHPRRARAHFDAVYQAYLMDEETLAFLREKNPDALQGDGGEIPRGDRARTVDAEEQFGQVRAWRARRTGVGQQ
jgi:cobaltochelatase CobN